MDTGRQTHALGDEVPVGAMEMPRYRSHKTVRALKIASVIHVGESTDTSESPIVDLVFEDTRFAPLRGVNTRSKPCPENGWYLVRYEDGYISFSPAPQFEEGNTLIGDSEAHHHVKGQDLRSFPQSDIDNWFTYHAPTPEQLVQYQEIRTAGKIFAETINRHVPAGPDKSAAMRILRETVMTANAAIACYVNKEEMTTNPDGSIGNWPQR